MDTRDYLMTTGVCKSYDNTPVLLNVNLIAKPGEIVALVGHNASGKSTLLKVIAGALRLDAGTVSIGANTLTAGDTMSARRSGISMVFQDCALCPDGSVLENLFLGAELTTSLGFLLPVQMRRKAQEILAKYRLSLPEFDQPIRGLSGGQRKMVAITRAMLTTPRYLLLDEPTAALGVEATESILLLLMELRNQGVAIIFCSHIVDEVVRVADRIAVLKAGRMIQNTAAAGLSRSDIAMLMGS